MSGFSPKEIVEWVGGSIVNNEVIGEKRLGECRIVSVASLATSRGQDLAFFFSRAYQGELMSCQAGALITGESFVDPIRESELPLWYNSVLIAVSDPYLAMAVVSEKFARKTSSVFSGAFALGKPEVHPTAVVHPTVELGSGARIGPHCVVERDVTVGVRTVLYPGCFLGPEVTIGDDCILFPNVVVYEWTQIGSRVRIHAGSVLGADGFGYAPKREAGRVVDHQKIYHLGRVTIGDDVEIGANSCVDRSTFGETRIDRRAKLDNQVHIGHNARVGEGAILCGGVCLAGSASVGKFAYIGGMTGISNQVHVGDRATVGACSLVSKDVPPDGTAVGNPQRERREHFRVHAILSKLGRDRRGRVERE